MRKEKQYNRTAIVVAFICILLLGAYIFYSNWQKEKNVYVYEEHLDDVVVTVDNRAVTLREFGYYIAKMEKSVQEQALIYNHEDPMEYWNLHFSAGLDSGYMFEYAWDYAVADCICDLVFEKKAQEEGYIVPEEELQQVKKRAEEIYAGIPSEQMQKIGLTIDLIMQIEERRKLVQLYADSYLGKEEITGYIDNLMEYMSGNDSFVMNSGVLQGEIVCNGEMKNNIRMGKITVNCDNN